MELQQTGMSYEAQRTTVLMPGSSDGGYGTMIAGLFVGMVVLVGTVLFYRRLVGST
ncbi:hypothetical protein HNV12_16290 [Methanococcoides sp. SA1]|nr:hypothetical protein [Methanococcoides sp. SA1]